jgi:phosphoribosylanthranilate isomerase
MPLVKICGITSLRDALGCVEAGADALGFNFYPSSPRYIDPVAVRRIVADLPASVLTVGVFVNERTPEAVEEIASAAGVEAVQLHGEETPEYCDALAHRFVIKVLRVGESFQEASALDYAVPAIMLDAFDRKARGGTGRVIDWKLARETRQLVGKLFLAGGLSPENAAAAISAVDPYAVDACSALEVKPGEKDLDRVREFVKVAHLPVKR